VRDDFDEHRLRPCRCEPSAGVSLTSAILPAELILGVQIKCERHCFVDGFPVGWTLRDLLLVAYLWAAIVLKYACEGSG
jgi:hypothetical protein